MKNTFIIFLFLNVSVFVYSQTDMPEARNTIYLDFGVMLFPMDATVGFGINYERMIHKNFNVRVGLNSCFYSGGGLSFALPVSSSLLTSGNNKLEIGLGGGPAIKIARWGGIEFGILPAIKLGYHYQLRRNSMSYRFGFDFPANLYVAPFGIGYSFK